MNPGPYQNIPLVSLNGDFSMFFFGAELVRDTRVDASELQGWDKGNTNR